MRDRSDRAWSLADAPWQRLQWARKTHGAYPSAASFARATGMKEHTYTANERNPDDDGKSINLSYDNAVAWAAKLDVRWQWLFRGEGLPWREESEVTAPPEAEEARDLVAAESDPLERRRMIEVLRALKRA